MTKVLILAVVSLALVSSYTALAEPVDNKLEDRSAKTGGPQINTEVEMRQYELEKKKVEIEQEKLELEKKKQKKESETQDAQLQLQKWVGIGTVFAIFLPLAAGFFSLKYQTKKTFQLKAAEIVLSSRGTYDGSQRAAALRELFPKEIQNNFGAALKLPGEDWRARKLELFKVLASTQEKQKMPDILRLYLMIYPEDGWSSELLEQHWNRWYVENEEDSRFVAEMRDKLATWEKWNKEKEKNKS